MESIYERSQTRDPSKLPPIHPDLIRGTENSVLSPVAVRPIEIIDSGPRVKPPEEQIKDIQEKLRVDAGLPKAFDANVAIGDPQAAIREWQRLYGPK